MSCYLKKKNFYPSGTGKTACVMAVIKQLKQRSARGEIPAFEFVVINGLKLKHPTDAYSALWKAGRLY